MAVVRAIGVSRQRCRKGCKHGSGDGIAGAYVCREYPMVASRCDVKKSTGNEFFRWSIEVVNPPPVFAKQLKMARGEREPT